MFFFSTLPFDVLYLPLSLVNYLIKLGILNFRYKEGLSRRQKFQDLLFYVNISKLSKTSFSFVNLIFIILKIYYTVLFSLIARRKLAVSIMLNTFEIAVLDERYDAFIFS